MSTNILPRSDGPPFKKPWNEVKRAQVIAVNGVSLWHKLCMMTWWASTQSNSNGLYRVREKKVFLGCMTRPCAQRRITQPWKILFSMYCLIYKSQCCYIFIFVWARIWKTWFHSENPNTYLKSEYINVLWTRFSTPEENRIIRSQNLFTRVETLTCLDKPMEPLDPGVVLDQCGYDFIPAIAGPSIWGN